MNKIKAGQLQEAKQKLKLMECQRGGIHISFCATCPSRFVCLSHRYTDEDIEALAEKLEIPKFLMNVPNTEEGRKFWELFKKFLNKNAYTVRRYGRGKDRAKRGGHQSFIPIGNCDYFGVYLSYSKLMAAKRRVRRKRYPYANGEDTIG